MLFSLLFLVLVVVVFGIGLARLLMRGSLKTDAVAADVPTCGRCGYGTRGISSLECPECGADLRVVGIRKPGEGKSLLAGCLMPLAFSFATYLLAILLFALLESFVVPTHSSDDFDLTFIPVSDEYDAVTLECRATSIIPVGQNMTSGGFEVDTINRFTAPRTSVSLYDPGTEVRIHELRLAVDPRTGQGPARTTSYFELDPKTAQASWIDEKGKPQRSKGAVTDKDVLAYLGSTGADTTDADVVLESQQVHKVVDGMLNGTYQFKIDGLSSAGYGAGSSGSTGPPWFLPVYAGAWVLVWIAGLVLIIRRSSKASRGTVKG